MKYIDAEKLKILVKRQIRLENLNFAALGGGGQTFCTNTLEWVLKQIDSLTQEQPNKESLNESQREFVNIVTERMLKEGPIPTLKGKQKAEFEKEFNRFKQITGMINFPAHMEIYKKIILWFMAWGADNLPNLNKVTNSDEFDFQQEQPSLPDNLDEAAEEYLKYHKLETASIRKLSMYRSLAFKAGAEWQKEQMLPIK